MTDSKHASSLLIVEDNEADSELAKIALEDAGIIADVHVATRLGEALEHLQSDDVDVALLDMGLPDTEGLQDVQQIVEHVPFVPIVLLTGTIDEQIGLRALESGAEDYLLNLDDCPVDSVKIDQGFAKQVSARGGRGLLAAGVQSIAKGLGWSIVADGVETGTQLDVSPTLKFRGVLDEIDDQPLSTDRFEACLAQQQHPPSPQQALDRAQFRANAGNSLPCRAARH